MRSLKRRIQIASCVLVLILGFQNCGGQFKASLFSTQRLFGNRLSANGNDLGNAAVFNDLVSHFWTNDPKGGHTTPTTWGYTGINTVPNIGLPANVVATVAAWSSDPRRRPKMWDRSEFGLLMYDQASVTGSKDVSNMLASDWQFIRNQYSDSELRDCRDTTSQVIAAIDDAGLEAVYYVRIYEAFGDTYALDLAKSLIQCSYSFYATPSDNSHGLYYNSAHTNYPGMSETWLAYAASEIYQLTGDATYRAYSQQTYDWITRDLHRNDGMYFMSWDLIGGAPVLVNQPNNFQKLGSATSLAGNMVMAVLNSRLYSKTGKQIFLDRSIAITNGIANKLITSAGLYLNSRDPWSESLFVIPFIREVLNLPGVPAAVSSAFINTANSIINNARTSDGYYSADWDGGDSWIKTAVGWTGGQGAATPQEIYTNVQASYMVLAANAVVQQQMVIGNIDSVDANGVRGWTCALGNDSSIPVDLYVGGAQFAHTPGTALTEVIANQGSGETLRNACVAGGKAYRFTIPWPTGSINTYQGQTLFVYGVPPSGLPGSQLSGGPFTVPAPTASMSPAPSDPTPSDPAPSDPAPSDPAPTPAPAPAGETVAPVYRFYGGPGDHIYRLAQESVVNYNLEGQAFSINVNNDSNTVGLYKCMSGGDHFLSLDSACEGNSTVGQLGYIHTDKTDATVPLYRFSSPDGVDHLVTTNLSEGQAAGYTLEGTMGYVQP